MWNLIYWKIIKERFKFLELTKLDSFNIEVQKQIRENCIFLTYFASLNKSKS